MKHLTKPDHRWGLIRYIYIDVSHFYVSKTKASQISQRLSKLKWWAIWLRFWRTFHVKSNIFVPFSSTVEGLGLKLSQLALTKGPARAAKAQLGLQRPSSFFLGSINFDCSVIPPFQQNSCCKSMVARFLRTSSWIMQLSTEALWLWEGQVTLITRGTEKNTTWNEILSVVVKSFSTSCQVRVVRFYVSLIFSVR